jgi:diadenosine tetraphosphate (Ap4A) HIT family hydrolase
VWDAYPVNPGHALVVSRRQISDWWAATTEERTDLMALVDEVRAHIEERHKPDGFNVGFNAGTVAGQTIELDVFGDPHQLGRLLSSENR